MASIDWIEVPITEFATLAPSVTTQFPRVLNLNGSPVVTIQVLIPIERGIAYSSSVPGQEQAASPVIVPGTATATVSGLVIWVDAKGTQILYQDLALVTAVPSTLPPSVGTASFTNTSSATASRNSSAAQTPQSNSTSPGTDAGAQPKNGSPELSSGAIAGIAIGCLLAGALLAGIFLWFCWRRKKVPNSQHAQGNTYAMASQEKGFSADTTVVSGKGLMGAGSRTGLPQPLEDKAISGDISKISNAIKNHVQSYYHNSRVTPGLIDYDDLHALGSNLPISVGTLTTLLGSVATREIALRFIIAWVLVSKLQPSKDPSKSLLPSELAQCYQVIATGDRGYQAQASLMARWRVMTAELMQPSYVRNPFSPSDSRHASIQATLAVLDNVLQPYADSRMNNGERKRNLEEVLKRAALFAFTLFSQPSVWEFEWQEEQGVTSGELCIFPALVQVADEAGHPVSPPRPFSEAVVRRLDS